MEGSPRGVPSRLPNLPPWAVPGVPPVRLSHFSKSVQHPPKIGQCHPHTGLCHISTIQFNPHQRKCMAASQPRSPPPKIYPPVHSSRCAPKRFAPSRLHLSIGIVASLLAGLWHSRLEAGALRRIKETSGKCWAECGEITVDLGQVESGASDLPGGMLAWGVEGG